MRSRSTSIIHGQARAKASSHGTSFGLAASCIHFEMFERRVAVTDAVHLQQFVLHPWS